MTIQLFLQLLETVAVVAGVVLGLAQLRHLGRTRERTSAMELLHSFQTPEFAKGLILIYEMPEGLSKAQVLKHLGDDVHLVYSLTTTWESLGILVYRGEIALDMVADFFSGPIIVSWQKMQKYFHDEREAAGRQTMGEWFEWLRDRLVEAESKTPPVPAHVEHRDWKPPRRK